uniref:Uncharacterized protein n=1 Tax=Euplotes crassus TaxID=5936 RepID=A0A7S3NYY9_EUPCR|mmetsp:Transcript_34489/g.34127  ORF Transcript_34489/g.34127 Transcript_34489/m.34127 type:complete len:756 (+) Transcript_34489:76-2343(+)|eukprot:CAMPEP_0197003856 /NCGR_PEP_ID=MMETSP1380-20130617/14489_1 /TAXON_ID=5936 /ORGANISM="Euplotes crassus, Strain CT5" /LENGTH=755 /DNA_ID=CAMNT_0042422463 /DNA_START=76 /DNA_END=2343 /DNA_ORIENTATION=-
MRHDDESYNPSFNREFNDDYYEDDYEYGRTKLNHNYYDYNEDSLPSRKFHQEPAWETIYNRDSYEEFLDEEESESAPEMPNSGSRLETVAGMEANNPGEVLKSEKEDNPGHTFSLVIFIMTLFVAIKFLFMNTNFFLVQQKESFERNAYYSLLKDISFMVGIMLVVLIVHYYEGFTSFNTSVDNVLYGMFFFILCYMIFGYFIMKASFKKIKVFNEFEKVTKDRAKLSQMKVDFENQFYGPEGVEKGLKGTVEYILMKQSFISPVELPTVTESYLRKDFDLALYFGHCLSEFLSKLFSFDHQAYLIIFCVVLFWKVCSMIDILFQSVLMVLFPVTSFIYLWIQNRQYKRIYKNLNPKLNSSGISYFESNLEIEDPFELAKSTPCPAYMKDIHSQAVEDDSEEGSSESDDDSVMNGVRSRNKSKSKSESIQDGLNDSICGEESEKSLEEEKNLFKSSESFLGTSQNRHERLFYLGKFGIFLEKLWMQSFFVQMILWISHLVEYKYLLREGTEDYYITRNGNIDYIIMLVSLLIGLYNLLVVFPRNIFNLVVITSIQMMKKKDMIDETIKEQRYQRSLRSFRLYKVFKIIRRELIDYFNVELKDKQLETPTKKLIEENYSLSLSKDNQNRESMDISKFFPLCGTEGTLFEKFLLVKKSGDEGIKPEDLIQAIQEATNDVNIDPYETIKTIFTLVMKDKECLTIEDIRNFFSTYEGYFEKGDPEFLLNELAVMQRSQMNIQVHEIASLIRDDIECFPR